MREIQKFGPNLEQQLKINEILQTVLKAYEELAVGLVQPYNPDKSTPGQQNSMKDDALPVGKEPKRGGSDRARNDEERDILRKHRDARAKLDATYRNTFPRTTRCVAKRGSQCGMHCGLLATVGFTLECEHYACDEFTTNYLHMIMDNGLFPALCPECKIDANGGNLNNRFDRVIHAQAGDDVKNDDGYGRPLDKANMIRVVKKPNIARAGQITKGVLAFFVERGIIRKDFAVRFTNQEDTKARERANEEQINLVQAKRCPSCKAPTSHYKEHGCHHILPPNDHRGGCPVCHTHYCFVCLGEWGPKDDGISVCLANGCYNFCYDAGFKFNDGTIAETDCGCPICPDCTPGEPCTLCEPPCPACDTKADESTNPHYGS